jgi:hypothetical protein
MKTFLSFTAVVEALTGIGLLFFPRLLVSFLLQREFDETGGIVIAMVAGGSVISLATGCWLFRQNDAALTFSKVLLIYNSAVVVIVIFAYAFLKFTSIPLWLIAGFHLIQAIWGLKLLLKRKSL